MDLLGVGTGMLAGAEIGYTGRQTVPPCWSCPLQSGQQGTFLLTLVSLLVGFWPPSVSPLSLDPTLKVDM